MNKKFTVYLSPGIIMRLKVEAAKKGQMHYSSLIESKIRIFFDKIKNIGGYSELKNNKKYKNLLSTFSPSKRGRPWDKGPSEKKKSITLYMPESIFKSISKFAKSFGQSNSSIVELAILLDQDELIVGIPLSNKFRNMSITDLELATLLKRVEDSGADDISEFLYVCQYSWVMDVIRKEINSNRQER